MFCIHKKMYLQKYFSNPQKFHLLSPFHLTWLYRLKTVINKIRKHKKVINPNLLIQHNETQNDA